MITKITEICQSGITKSAFWVSLFVSLVTLTCWLIITQNVDFDEVIHPVSKLHRLVPLNTFSKMQSRLQRLISRHTEPEMQSAETNETKTILLWHPLYKTKAYVRNEFRKYCPDIQCEITDKRAQLSIAHAVVFEVELVYKVPEKYSGQVWIFMEQEAPSYLPNGIKKWNNLFNWTMTYRRDSDIPLFYGGVVKGSTTERISEISIKFKKDILWIVSHCKTPGKREDLIRKLQKHFTIDTFGRCGKKLPNCSKEETCIDKSYKYYFAAENAHCRDYMTEKPLKCYDKYIIPIVRGGLTYDTYLPPNSYIDVNKFKSVEHLIMFLQHVGSNKTEYNKYFTYKRSYHLANTDILHRETKRHPYCELCRRLFHREKYRKIYNNIHDWWRGNEKDSGYMCPKEELVPL